MFKSCKCPTRYIRAPFVIFYSIRESKPLQILSKELLAFIQKVLKCHLQQQPATNNEYQK